MSYGTVARLSGFPRHARMVSKAMGRCDDKLPWYRVVKSDYSLAFEIGSKAYKKQRHLLEKEGVVFINGKVSPIESDDETNLDKLLWAPDE